jgi:hypothetical protein
MRNDRQKQPKQPNACKHGIFSRLAILPGENPKEFAALYTTLFQELKPSGATEEDAVLSIANTMWRRRRAQRFLEIQLMKDTFDPRHPSYDESQAFTSFAAVLRARPDVAFEEFATGLRPARVQYLTNKFPRSDFKSTPEWAKAVINEIESVLLPQVTPAKFHQFGEFNSLFDSHVAQLRSLLDSYHSLTEDVVDKDLSLNERLDTMLERAIKRLIQVKAMKQMLGQPDAERVENQVRKIGVKKAANG